MSDRTDAKVGVLVVAYNAASTLAQVLDRLPASFRARVDHVLVCDDASQDATHLIALGYQTITDLPLTVIRHQTNLGYGGNQKAGYRWAIEHGLDVIVLLHGDGQYQPEAIESLVDPLVAGEADAVFGSRMMDPGGARRGGMPMYKYVGNKILTTVENKLADMSLSEWHSGYRAYRIDALKEIPFETFSNGFDFDTEIILELNHAGKHILEVPIATYYGDEICHVNGMKYAKDVVVHASAYRMRQMGFGGGLRDDTDAYELKSDEFSSHATLLRLLSKRAPGRVLDLGCSDGALSNEMRKFGHHVTGMDVIKHDRVAENVDEFVEADLNQGVPSTGEQYDIIVCADVLEHLVQPHHLMESLHELLAPGGSVYVSVPNFGHWYPRFRVFTGKFDYDRRGILDSGHLRFFTRRSFERLAHRAGFRVRRVEKVGLPLAVLEERSTGSAGSGGVVPKIDRLAASAWPGMFAYQYVFELKSEAEKVVPVA